MTDEKELPTWLQNLIAEKQHEDGKIERLQVTLKGDTSHISAGQLELLNEQLASMQNTSRILGERIELA